MKLGKIELTFIYI